LGRTDLVDAAVEVGSVAREEGAWESTEGAAAAQDRLVEHIRATRSHSSESDPKAPVDVPAFEGSPRVDGPSAVDSARREK
jgi:hypothetical protein